jgi:site-specific DNA-methyltransferase (adenine-specific)
LELDKIYNMDCLEGMKEIEDKSIDLIITDPPYGKKASKGTNGFGTAKNRRYVGEWDNNIPSKEIFNEMLRISKNVIVFGGNYFAHILPPSNHWVVWDKKGDIAFKNPFADCELIYTNFNKPIKKIVFKQQGFITDSKDIRYHPTQKPSELLQILIERYSKENDIILDCFIGSGSTAIACINTNRRFIGFELDTGYFNIANERIIAVKKATS